MFIVPMPSQLAITPALVRWATHLLRHIAPQLHHKILVAFEKHRNLLIMREPLVGLEPTTC